MSKIVSYLKNTNLSLRISNHIDTTNLVLKSLKGYPKTFKTISRAVKEIGEVKDFEKNIIFSPYKKDHVNLSDSIGSSNAGKSFVREQSLTNPTKSLLRQATASEIEKASILAFGGIDFDSEVHFSALLKSAHTLASYKQGNNYSAIAIAPEVSRSERYEAAVNYNINPKFSPKYIVNRVEKYILPKISSKDIVFSPKYPISLFSFSVGGREVLMMENAIKDVLKVTYGLNNDELYPLLTSLRAVCLGFAADPAFFKEQGFMKLIIFSPDDIKVLRPKALHEDILLSPAVINSKFYIHQFEKHNKIDNSKLLILGHGTIPHVVNNKISVGDHSLPHYIEGIKLLPSDIQNDICKLLSYEDPSQLNEVEITGLNV